MIKISVDGNDLVVRMSRAELKAILAAVDYVAGVPFVGKVKRPYADVEKLDDDLLCAVALAEEESGEEIF